MSNLRVLSEDFRCSVFCIHAVSPALIKQGPALQIESMRLILSSAEDPQLFLGLGSQWGSPHAVLALLTGLSGYTGILATLHARHSESAMRVCKAEEGSKNPTSWGGSHFISTLERGKFLALPLLNSCARLIKNGTRQINRRKEKVLVHAHGVATEMGSKKRPKQAVFMLLRQIKICKEDRTKKLGFGVPN